MAGICESFKERISIAAKMAGNATELARKTGISRRAIGTYLAGTSDPTRERLISIAEVAGVSVEWLATGRGMIQNPASGARTQGCIAVNATTCRLFGAQRENDSQVAIPHYVLEFADTTSKAPSFRMVGQVYTNQEGLNSLTLSHPENLKWITVANKSSLPLGLGSSLLLDAGQLVNGNGAMGIYLLNIDGQLQICVARSQSANHVQVIAGQANYPQSLVYPTDQLEVLGKVVWSCGVV